MRGKVDPKAGQEFSSWVDALEEHYGDRVLVIDSRIARIWAELSADRTRPVVDTLLAATAIHYGLVLVTRNVRDVEDTPVVVRNPWLD